MARAPSEGALTPREPPTAESPHPTPVAECPYSSLKTPHKFLLLAALQQHLHRARRGQVHFGHRLLHPRDLLSLPGEGAAEGRLPLLQRVEELQPGIAQRG